MKRFKTSYLQFAKELKGCWESFLGNYINKMKMLRNTEIFRKHKEIMKLKLQ